MIDVSVKNLVKSFRVGENVLNGLSFEVQSGEKVGILGKNGCGKTTLFRILAGETGVDEGEVATFPGKRLGLISQIPAYPADYTTEDVLKTAHARVDRISARLTELQEEMASNCTGEVLREYDTLSAEFERLGGYDVDFERSRVANGLDIPADMRSRLFSQLSGGEKTRVNLARLILEDTDILLLDEPTNHLDLKATEWLESYLLRFRGTVLAISHDRWFLDRVAERCIEIVDGRAEFYSGSYSFFIEEKKRRFEEKMRIYEKNQAKIEQLEKAAADMHLWAFMGNDKLHKRAFSMEKRIERLRTVDRPTVERRMKARFASRDFSGDEVLVLEGISKSFGRKKLFENIDLLVEGQERIALIGDNGTGKTTLVKILLGLETPDSGHIHKGPTVKTAYLPQHVFFEREDRTLYDTMLYEGGCLPQAARDRLAAFNFRGEDVFKQVRTLSGGEKSRLRLCVLMKNDINLLILDEPTNHLDIASREWIEDAVADYGEALIFVSHDRWFIEKFATRIWEISGGTITDYVGTFSQYREFKARQEAIKQAEKSAGSSGAKKEPPAKPAKKPNAKAIEKQLQKVEREIARLEASAAELDARAEAHASDYQKLLEIADEKQAVEAELEGLMEEWEKLSEM